MAPSLKRPYTARLSAVALPVIVACCLIAGCGEANNPAPTPVASTRTAPGQATLTAGAEMSLATVTPVPTSAQSWTTSEQAYISKVGAWGDRYSGDLTKITGLLSNPNPFDSGWTSGVDSIISDFEALNNEVLNYTAPARFAGIQENLAKAAGRCEDGANLVTEGISEFDLGKIERGASDIQAGAMMVPQAVKDLGQLTP